MHGPMDPLHLDATRLPLMQSGYLAIEGCHIREPIGCPSQWVLIGSLGGSLATDCKLALDGILDLGAHILGDHLTQPLLQSWGAIGVHVLIQRLRWLRSRVTHQEHHKLSYGLGETLDAIRKIPWLDAFAHHFATPLQLRLK